MFERIVERARRRAEQRAALRREEIEQRAGAVPGVQAEAVADGVLLSGRALRRRLALEPALRTLAERTR
jgi:hypothetical protein